MDYLPALGLGKNQQGITQLPDFKMQTTKEGLGYKGEKVAKDGKVLEDFFVPESGIIYPGRAEPVDVGKIQVPGFEIFKDLLDVHAVEGMLLE